MPEYFPAEKRRWYNIKHHWLNHTTMHPHHLTSATRNGSALLKTAFSRFNFTRITLTLLFSFFITHLYCQAPPIQWQKQLGGLLPDHASSIEQTTDGGYIVAGFSESNNGDVSGNHGYRDYWIVKSAATGNIQWQRCLGGSLQDNAHSIQQTTDGGYIVAGSTDSNNGDVSGNHGGGDYWIVKLAATGNIQWQRCLGGSGYDYAYSIHQTTDGGYIVAGESGSNDGDISGNHGYFDFWIVKLAATGNIQWQQCLGGSGGLGGLGGDAAYSIGQTTDGGYIVAGTTGSNNGDVSGNHGGGDYWIVKLAATGIIQWQRCLGGSDFEWASKIEQTTDGGYIITGGTRSNDGDVSGNHGDSDYWIVKLDATGNIQWQRCLGGSGGDVALSIEQTTDDGYIVAGSTDSNNGDVSGNHGGSDYWIVKLAATGNIQWQRCLGGSGYDYANSIQQTTDGGYIVAGFTDSNDGDVSGNHGNFDTWIVKLGFDALPIKLTSITARNRGNVNIINWSSASEDAGERYELQRSADGVRFSAIASLPGNGRSADYEFTDTGPVPGFNYYRLLLINNDGNNTFSKIVRAFVKTGIELQLSPNPAKEILTIQIRGSVVRKASLQITDGTGKTLLLSHLINNEPKRINISMLAPGVYFLRYRDDQQEIVKKFVVN
jgi:hypothetical protein